MSLAAWITVAVIVLVIGALLTNRISVDVAMIGGLTLLIVADAFGLEMFTLEEALGGFAHRAVIMIGALFVMAAGVQETGAMELIAQRLLGRPRSIAAAQVRLMGPVAIMSAMMNNTPIVAMYLPIVNDWARKLRISPSKLFMPLSFAAILGGKITYIGTASNIVVFDLFLQALELDRYRGWLDGLGVTAPSAAVQFWGIAVIGVPSALAGMAVIVLFSRWLLPERRPADAVTLDARRYQVDLEVHADSPIVGKTIEDAGLRHLPGLFLTEIERDGDRLPAVSPDERLHAGDRLAFAGILESVVDLRRIRGLVPATDQVQKVEAQQQQRTLVEAVVSRKSPLVGRTVRKSQFRTRYNAAIIAVHRNGEHVKAKIGDISLRPGDTLLLDTHTGFVNAHRNSDDFYLVSTVEGTRPVLHERAWIALAIFGLLIFLLTAQIVPPVTAALLCAMAMIVTRCTTGTNARGSINWQVLMVIAAALGLGSALRETGAADAIAGVMLALGDRAGVTGDPHAMLLLVFTITAIFSQLITNNGAAVLMVPITMTAAQGLDVRPEPFVFALMVAAGSSFLSPVAYQTNLMVYGPGGYRFGDYVRLGLPITVVVALVTTFVAPMFFPFH